jgi:O-antigen ligase
MGNVLFAALGLATIGFGMVNRRALVLIVVLFAGIPIALMTRETEYFGALGGMSGQAAWLFAIVIGCLAALIAYLGRLPAVLGSSPLLLIFLVLAAISLTWANSVLDGARMLAKLAAPILFFWVVLLMQPQPALARRIESVLYLTCVIAVLLAYANVLSGGALAPLPLKSGVAGMRELAAPFTSPANFSFLILVGAITAYVRFLNFRSVWHLALFLFFLIAIGLAFVRISLVGALLGIAAVHLVRARPLASVVFAGLAVSATALVVTSDVFMQRMFFVPERVRWSELVTSPEKFLSNVNTSGRTMLWARASRAFADESTLVGAGVGSVDAWINTGDSFSSELHSEVFRLRLELGWLGLAVFSFGLIALWRRLLRAQRRAPSDEQSVALRASCALLPVYTLTLLTDNTINYAAGFGVLVYGFAALALVEVAQRSSAVAEAQPDPLSESASLHEMASAVK